MEQVSIIQPLHWYIQPKKSKVTNSINPKAHFHTDTRIIDNRYKSKPLSLYTVTLTMIKVGMRKLKYQYQPLSYHTAELKIMGLEEFRKTEETKWFSDTTTSHILGHWKENISVRVYNVNTNYIPTHLTGPSHLRR